jgi:hypothetical protein
MPQTARPVVWEGRDAQSSRLHPIKQEDQSQPHGISCTQRTLRNAEDTKL